MTLPNSHIPSFIDSGFISRSGYFCLVISARSSLTKRAIFDLGNKYFIRLCSRKLHNLKDINMESVIEIFQRSNKEWREEWPFDPLLGFSKLTNGEIKKIPEEEDEE